MAESSEAKIRESREVVDPAMNGKKSHGGVKVDPENIRHDRVLSTKTRRPKCTMDPQSVIFLKRLEEQAELYPKKIESERMKISKLDEMIEAMQKKVLMQRSRMGGIDASQESNKTIAKQICILESRLENALGQLNEGQAVNRQLRERIDCLRRERVTFDSIYKRLENDLHTKRKEMGVILEESIAAYKAREKVHADLQALYQQAENDKREFEDEWKGLGRLVEQHKKLRADAIQEQQPPPTLATVKTGKTDDGNIKGRNPLCLVPDIHGIVIEAESSKTTGSFPRDQLFSHKTSERYQSVFNVIQEITGEMDISKVVNIFTQAEESKFSLLNLINELSCEIERLHRDVESTKMEIDKTRGGMGISIDIRMLNSIWKVEDELSDVLSKAEKQEIAHETVKNTLKQLKTGIESTYKRLNANSVDSIITNQGNITEGNILHYLALIEKKATEILQAYVHSSQSTPGASIIMTTAAPSSNLSRSNKEMKDPSKKVLESDRVMVVHPPGLQDINSDDYSDGDDDCKRYVWAYSLE